MWGNGGGVGPPGVSQAMEEQSLRERKKLKTEKGRWWGAPPAGPAPGVSRLPRGERGNGREDGVARGGGVTGRLLWVWSPSFSVTCGKSSKTENGSGGLRGGPLGAGRAVPTLGADFELGSVRVPEAKNS